MASRPTYDYVADLYRNVLGREGSDSEIQGWTNADDADAVRSMFLSSPEYTSKHGGTAGWQDVGGVITPAQRQAPSDQPRVLAPPALGPQRPVATYSGAAAAAPPPTTGDWNKLHGFDAKNYYDPNMGTMKYQFGRIANEYDPSQPGSLDAIMADPRFKAAFPKARKVGKDSIDFGGQLSDGATGTPVGVVDVGEAFGDNGAGRAFQWLDQGGGGGSTGLPSGTTRTSSGGSDSQGGSNSLANFASLGQFYGGPGGPGITNGPLQQMGQDPLSQLITGALASFIGNEGSTGFGDQIKSKLLDQIDGKGADTTAARYESARELLDKGRRTMINDARGDLASRGLLSEPGIPQGAETGAIRRITENLAPEFTRTLRDITSDEANRADARVQNALSLATGMAGDEAKQFLAGIGEGTARQTALAQIALQTLAQNQSWSQFLAEFGLKRDTTLEMLQQGRVDDVMSLLQNFLALTNATQQGYI